MLSRRFQFTVPFHFTMWFSHCKWAIDDASMCTNSLCHLLFQTHVQFLSFPLSHLSSFEMARKGKKTNGHTMTEKPSMTEVAESTFANYEPILDLCDDRPEPTVPACGIPKNVIAAMIAAGAKKEQLEGEDLCVLRVESVDSEAWKLYEDWASSLGEVDPMVVAHYAPPLHLRRTLLCPPRALVADILDEANSIINLFAPLVMEDLAEGIPALLAAFTPLPAPVAPINIHHAKAAVIALQRAIRNPGPTFPVINGLHRGLYICQVEYTWSGVIVVVSIFRL